MDDCGGGEGNIKWDKTLEDLFWTGRHLHITPLVTSQDVKGLPPALRDNADLAFSFNQLSWRQMDAIREGYCTFMDDVGTKGKFTFKSLIEKYCKDDHFLCFDLADKIGRGMDLVYTGKAEEPPFFRMGCEEYWKEANIKRQKVPPTERFIRARSNDYEGKVSLSRMY